MATIPGTIAIIGSNVAFAAGGAATALTSDLATDRQTLTAGVTYYSIAWAYTGRDLGADSNRYYHGYQLTVWIRHRLSNPNSEGAWMSGGLAEPILRALGDPAFWKAGGGMVGTNPDVYDFQRGNDALVLSEPEREGNIISFSAVAKLLLNA